MFMKLTFVAALAVVLTCASGTSSDTGRDLLGVESCGVYGKCRKGYSCGTLKAKQCYTSPKPTEKCTKEEACLEDLEECGPEAFCKFNEKCVKDVKCYAEYTEFVSAEKKPKKEILETDCFTCQPLEFEEECETVDVEVCDKVKEQKCELVPTKECWDSPERKCEKVSEEVCQTVLKEKCEWIKQEVCENKTEVVCKDVPKETCTQGGEQCLDRNACEIKPVGAQLCTTEEVCTDKASFDCERRKKLCDRIPDRASRPAAQLLSCEPCPTERKCEQVEKCVTLTAPACGAFDAFPTARNECAAQPLATCTSFVKNICLNVPPGCTTTYEKVCQEVTKPVCSLVDKYVCNKVPVEECNLVWKDKCKTVYKRRCETVDVKQCWPVWVQKCETKEVEKCAPPEGIECGKNTCELGQKCGIECNIVEEEEEECKEVTIEACIPK
ncbi:hypothetical protein BSKO_06085 [Bryopsis sp. KO-2023]|nr:hypothetical protein BSKO_06085 [Bryopsis sp. KO-2023]